MLASTRHAIPGSIPWAEPPSRNEGGMATRAEREPGEIATQKENQHAYRVKQGRVGQYRLRSIPEPIDLQFYARESKPSLDRLGELITLYADLINDTIMKVEANLLDDISGSGPKVPVDPRSRRPKCFPMLDRADVIHP